MSRVQPWPISPSHQNRPDEAVPLQLDGGEKEPDGLVQACFDASRQCFACADELLGSDPLPVMVDCIRAALACAEISLATGRVLSRVTEDPIAHDLLRACETACRTCAEVCESHADLSACCRACAEACRRAERACQERLPWP